VTDDRPVIDAPTAEQLSGRIPAVQPPPNRSRIREQRKARVARRHRRRGVTMLVLGIAIVAVGVLSWWSLKGDSTPPKTAVSGVSITAPSTVPSTVPTTPSTTQTTSNP
jgi:hypothetical protein